MASVTTNFSPFTDREGARAAGCLTCRHFRGRFLADHLVCEHRGGVQVIGRPELGCAYWEREAGSDDEPVESGE